MATTKRQGLPEFWVTGLAKLLVGDKVCEYEPWLKAHYRITKLDRDGANLTQWKMDHTAALRAADAKYKAEGYSTTLEQYVRLMGQTACITGKCDLILRKDGERPIIADTKGGNPRESDVAQVLIYMVIIPLAWNKPLTFNGRVIYKDHDVDVTPAEAQAIKPRLFELVRRLAPDTAPAPNPGESQCKFCEVNEADCPQRWKPEAEKVDFLTSEF